MATAVVGALVGISLLWTAPELGRGLISRNHWGAWALVFILFTGMLIPLPFSWIEWAQPARAELMVRIAEVSGEPLARWAPLSLSPGSSIERIWEILIFLGVFGLARQLVADWSGHFRALFLTLGLALMTLTVADYIFQSSSKIWGIQEVRWGLGAGTFANRNHFAGWIVVSSLFILGWIFRSLPSWRFRSRNPKMKRRHSRPFEAGILGLVVLLAWIQALQSGSRGAALGLVVGLIWIGIQLTFSARRSTTWVWVLVGVIGLLMFWDIAGAVVQNRSMELFLSQETSTYPKLSLWKTAWDIACKSKWFGAGWGGFLTASNLFRNQFETADLLHAENDYLEFFAEVGWVGIALSLLAVFLLYSRRKKGKKIEIQEPEIHLFAGAACLAFLAHASVEFVSHIPANFILFAVVLGFRTGQVDFIGKSMIRRFSVRRLAIGLGLGTLLLTGGFLQALATVKAKNAERIWSITGSTSRTPAENEKRGLETARKLEISLELWPAETDRIISWTRALAVQNMSSAERVGADSNVYYESTRDRILKRIAWDPYNWKVWLEMAWFDFTFSSDRERWKISGYKAIQYNPLQIDIPLQLSEFFQDRDPDLSKSFLEFATPTDRLSLVRALNQSWNLEKQTLALWNYTPNESWAFLELSNFAEQIQEPMLAVQACWAAKEQMDKSGASNNPNEIKQIILRLAQLNQPKLAETLIQPRESDRQILLSIAEAFHRVGDSIDSLRFSRSIWIVESWPLWQLNSSRNIIAPPGLWQVLQNMPESMVKNREAWQDDLEQCVQYALQISQNGSVQPQSISAFRILIELNPNNLNLRRALVESLEKLGQFKEAAKVSLNLARQVMD